jgi:hypothetical protein
LLQGVTDTFKLMSQFLTVDFMKLVVQNPRAAFNTPAGRELFLTLMSTAVTDTLKGTGIAPKLDVSALVTQFALKGKAPPASVSPSKPVVDLSQIEAQMTGKVPAPRVQAGQPASSQTEADIGQLAAQILSSVKGGVAKDGAKPKLDLSSLGNLLAGGGKAGGQASSLGSLLSQVLKPTPEIDSLANNQPVDEAPSMQGT